MRAPTPKIPPFLLTPLALLATAIAYIPHASAATANGGWTDTCSGAAVTTEGVLSANCFRGAEGAQFCSELDLNLCYAFSDDYKVHEQDGGNFMASCHSCFYSFQFGGGIVECTCAGQNGVPTRADVRTDDLVTNNGGYLQCFGHMAESC